MLLWVNQIKITFLLQNTANKKSFGCVVYMGIYVHADTISLFKYASPTKKDLLLWCHVGPEQFE